MTNDLMQAYTARISQASRTELVVIIYEIILSDIKAAQKAYESGNIAEYTKELKSAGRFLNELMGTLDYNYEISLDLMSLYIFVNKAISTATFNKNPEMLDGAASILCKLMEGFKEVCKSDNSGSLMKNTQQLYAGLTYGKGSLNEVFIDPQEQNRGYKI